MKINLSKNKKLSEVPENREVFRNFFYRKLRDRKRYLWYYIYRNNQKRFCAAFYAFWKWQQHEIMDIGGDIYEVKDQNFNRFYHGGTDSCPYVCGNFFCIEYS